MTTDAKADMPSPRRRRRWPVVVGAAFILLAVAAVSLPFIADWYATRWLRTHGFPQAEIGDVDLDLFRGRLAVDGLILAQDEARETRAMRTFVNIQWQGLFRKRVLLARLELHDAAVTVRRDEARDFFIADFLLTAREEVPADKPSESFDLQFGIEAIELHNVLVRYRGQLFDRDVLFDEFTIGNIATWDPDADTPVRLRASLDGRTHEIAGTFRPLAVAPEVDFAFRLDAIELDAFDRMLASVELADARGSLTADTRIRARFGADAEPLTLSIDGGISLADGGFRHPAAELGDGDIDWRGRVDLTLADSTLDLTARGQLGAAGLALRLPAPVAPDAATQPSATSLTVARADFDTRTLELRRRDEDLAVKLASQLRLEDAALESGGARAELASAGWDGDIDLTLAGGAPAGTVRGALGVAGLVAESAEGRLAAGGIELADTDLELAPGGDGDRLIVTTRAAVSDLSLGAGDGASSAQLGAADWEGRADLRLGEEGPAGAVEGALEVRGLAAGSASAGLDAGLGRAAWRGALTLPGGEEPVRVGDGRLDLASVALTGRDPAVELAGFDTLTASLRASEDQTLALDELDVGALRLLERPDAGRGEASHVLRASRVKVGGLALAPARTVIGLVTVEGLDAWVETGRDGLEATRLASASAGGEAGGDAAEAAPATTAAAATFRLEGFETRSPGSLRFVDRGVRPVVDLRFTALEVDLGALDSARPGTLTPLALGAAVGEYAKIRYEGELAPLAERLTLYGDGAIDGLEMPWLAGYQARAIGYRARSGILDADLDLKIEQDLLDSKAKLVIRQLDLDEVDAAEADEFTADLGMPLDKAIGLLQDKNGAIRMTVPFEGDLDNLSVGVGDALRTVWNKALRVAITHTATTFFAPLLPAVAVAKVVGMANKVRFRPVAFPPGSAALAPGQESYLAEMAGILDERPDVDVVVCGVGVPGDAVTAAAGAGGAGPDAAAAPEPASEQAILELAAARQAAVKSALVGRGVEPSRLATCAPEIDRQPDGTPRVELGV